MNVREKQKVLDFVPGLDASNCERIAEALQKLCLKIQCMELARQSSKQNNSNGDKTDQNSLDSDWSVADLQYHLLVIQLRYIRGLLRKKVNNFNVYNDPPTCSNESERKEAALFNVMRDDPVACHKETQTGSASFLVDEPIARDVAREREKVEQAAINSQVSAPHQNVGKSNSHYRLNLQELPFIVGTSTSNSHSVVANMQNIFAMMKTHNKNLCGGNINQRRAPNVKPCSSAKTSDLQDVNNMLAELTSNLTELQQKQELLQQRINAQETSISQRTNKNVKKSTANTDVKMKATKGANAEPNVGKSQGVNNWKISPEGHVIPTVITWTNSMLQTNRRRYMQSLKDLKTHLQLEDIVWT